MFETKVRKLITFLDAIKNIFIYRKKTRPKRDVPFGRVCCLILCQLSVLLFLLLLPFSSPSPKNYSKNLHTSLDKLKK